MIGRRASNLNDGGRAVAGRSREKNGGKHRTLRKKKGGRQAGPRAERKKKEKKEGGRAGLGPARKRKKRKMRRKKEREGKERK